MLSKRLQAISEFIPSKSKVIDVGADHALLDIYLTKEKNCLCLATDISEKCVWKALENIKKHQVQVKVKVADGLKGLTLNDEIIVIAGMGTQTILKIVPNNLTNDLIISSHHDIPLLRREMFKKGYYIFKEQAVYDKRYYVIIYFKKGRKKTNCYVSPFLTSNKEYMRFLLKKYENIFIHTKNKKEKLKIYLLMRKIKKFL